MPTTVDALNSGTPAFFVSALGGLFEHSPWVAVETYPQGPFASRDALGDALVAAMYAADPERQLALIRAHPDLAGRLAQAGALTAESTQEQKAAGLNTLTAAEAGEITRLNDAYRAKFGFPFIICARLNAKAAILAAMRTRLENDPAAEHSTALGEIAKIARLRLNDAVAP